MSDMPDYHMYVVPVNVAIPPGQTGISDILEYDLTPEDLADGARGPILGDVKGRPYVIIYGVPEIDHYKIKGVVLKDPTIAASLPSSIENPAIAYDATLDLFKMALYYDGTKIDPRTIRVLTSTDVVTVVQPTAANLKATVTQAEKDRTITGNVTVIQGTPANLKAEVSQPTAASLKATVTQAEKDRTVTGTVTAEQATAANLKATVTQAEKDRTVTGTVTAQQATAANLKATVTQAEKDRTISDITKTVTVATGEATASGNTEIITVSAGQKLRIKTISVWNNGTASLTVALRFTATGTLTYKKLIAEESGWILNLIGANWEGGTDEDLFINLSAAGTISYTIGYVEI